MYHYKVNNHEVDKMEKHKEAGHMANLYRILQHDTFKLDDLGDSYELTHKRIPLIAELPSELESGRITSVNMMAPLQQASSPEEVMRITDSLIRQRDYLRERGYHHLERFAVYDDGIEYKYTIPTESLDDLIRILQDLAECEDPGRGGGKK